MMPDDRHATSPEATQGPAPPAEAATGVPPSLWIVEIKASRCCLW